MAERMSLLELCTRAALAVENGDGIRAKARVTRRAGQTCSFIIEWAWMMRDIGADDPSVDDYAEWAHIAVRTGYYRLAAFRDLFGEWHPNPTPLARYVNEWVEAHADQHPRSATVPAVLAPA